MDTSTTLSITEARKQLFDIADKANKMSRHYILTEKGKPKVVIFSAEEYECWKETLDIIREFPDLKKEIKKIDKDIELGKHTQYPTLDEVLIEHGYVLADKIRKKSKKRSR